VTEPQAVIELDIESLQPNPLQPRGTIDPDSLSDLVNSIKEHGVLEPLVAALTPAGYQIIAGERRWRASKQAGLKVVPVIVKKTSPRGMLEMALVENVQRSDLNAIDRAKAFERLMVEFNLSSSEIAKRISKSVAYVSNSLRLLKLPDALKDGLLSGLITEGHARALSAIEDPRTMIEAYKIILRESGSVRRAEELARRMKKANGQMKSDGSDKRQTVLVNEEIDKIQTEIQSALGEKSAVKLKRTIRETRIQIVFKGSPDSTQPSLDAIHRALTALTPVETKSEETPVVEVPTN
jgi:ParB family chromosome partitioning protein